MYTHVDTHAHTHAVSHTHTQTRTPTQSVTHTHTHTQTMSITRLRTSDMCTVHRVILHTETQQQTMTYAHTHIHTHVRSKSTSQTVKKKKSLRLCLRCPFRVILSVLAQHFLSLGRLLRLWTKTRSWRALFRHRKMEAYPAEEVSREVTGGLPRNKGVNPPRSADLACSQTGGSSSLRFGGAGIDDRIALRQYNISVW
jgi:hypothetical protein